MSSSYSTILELLFVYGLACRRDATSYTARYSTGLRTTVQYCGTGSQYETANNNARPSVYLLLLFALIFDFDFGTVYMR
jgi:hypothetical protein